MAVNSSIISTSAVHQSDSQQAEGITAEDLVQYVVLRKDLWTEKQWPLGSIIAQGCHASTAALWLSRDSPATKAYCAPDKLDSMHKVCLLTTCLPGIAHGSDSKTGLALKVVLEVKGEPQLQTLSQRLSENGVEHKLWMEQPENIATCLATVPAGKSSIQQHFKKYQLCKGN